MGAKEKIYDTADEDSGFLVSGLAWKEATFKGQKQRALGCHLMSDSLSPVFFMFLQAETTPSKGFHWPLQCFLWDTGSLRGVTKYCIKKWSAMAKQVYFLNAGLS